MPVTVVQPGFVNRGPKRGSEATKRGEGVEVYSIHQPLPPLLNFPQSMGAWVLVPLSYASDSGAARICQQGAKARERSDQAGGGCFVGGGFPPPTVGRFFLKIRV